jgi:hypothetical protein
MSERRPILIFVVFLALMGGIVYFTTRSDTKSESPAALDETSNNADSNDDTTPKGTQNIVTGTTLPPISVPTTVANAGPDQFRAILENLIAKQNDLLQNPDPTRVGEIMDPTCKCYSETRQILQGYADDKWHVQGPAWGISAAALLSKSDTQMRISTTLVGRGNPTVDNTGATKEEGHRGPIQPVLYVLKKSADGRWVIADRQTYEER